MNNQIAVIMDSSELGQLYLVPVSTDGIDLERLAEAGWEQVGMLKYPGQYQAKVFADDSDQAEMLGVERYAGPYFTECEHTNCNKMIAIIGDGAPEFCTEHDTGEL